MKLSDWAKNKESAINKIAWRLYKQGHIKEYQLPTIIVQEEQRRENSKRCITYPRISDHQSKDNLERQEII